jgi:hypothetical protein
MGPDENGGNQGGHEIYHREDEECYLATRVASTPLQEQVLELSAVIGPNYPLLQHSKRMATRCSQRYPWIHHSYHFVIVLYLCNSLREQCCEKHACLGWLLWLIWCPSQIIHTQKGAWLSALQMKAFRVENKYASSGMQAACKQRYASGMQTAVGKKDSDIGQQMPDTHLLYSWLSKYTNASATGPYLTGVRTYHPTN